MANGDNVHVLVPKQLRLDWIDIIALDERLSHVTVRAAILLSHYFDNRTGLALIGLARLAVLLKVSERTAWGAVAELERCGYLIVQHGHGKGKANRYSMAIDKSQPVATKAKAKLATLCELADRSNSQNPASQVAASCDPSLKTPKGSSPKGDFSGLGKAVDGLGQRLGTDLLASWFSGVVASVDGTTLRLIAPSRFRADYIAQNFEHIALDVWREQFPSLRQVLATAAPSRRTA